MDKSWLERTELLVKEEGILKLQNANLLVVGLGGVGSFAAEFLARAGVGSLSIVDGDFVDKTNINRQLPALHSSIGKSKAELVEARLKDINPDINLQVISQFLNPEDMPGVLDATKYDYVLDCIDSVSPKVELIKQCRRRKIKIISCMGAGGKLDAGQIHVKDISKTYNCFLAKQIRKRVKQEANIDKGFKCVFSSELQDQDSLKLTDGTLFKRSFYGTISFIPAAFGLRAAAEVVNHLLQKP